MVRIVLNILRCTVCLESLIQRFFINKRKQCNTMSRLDPCHLPSLHDLAPSRLALAPPVGSGDYNDQCTGEVSARGTILNFFESVAEYLHDYCVTGSSGSLPAKGTMSRVYELYFPRREETVVRTLKMQWEVSGANSYSTKDAQLKFLVEDPYSDEDNVIATYFWRYFGEEYNADNRKDLDWIRYRVMQAFPYMHDEKFWMQKLFIT